MWYLKINYFIPYWIENKDLHQTNGNNNGVFEMYSDDKTKLDDIKDLVCLDFLSKLCCGFNRVYGENIRRRKISKIWNLDRRHDYIFDIDIYNLNYTECEIKVSLKQFHDGFLKKTYNEYLEESQLNHEIPDLIYNINQVDEVPHGINIDTIYYNSCTFFDEETFKNKVMLMDQEITDYILDLRWKK